MEMAVEEAVASNRHRSQHYLYPQLLELAYQLDK
jgi:hypothetical protein